MSKTATATSGTKTLRIALILAIVVLAFVASYQIANAKGANGASAGTGLQPLGASGDGTGAACACCGGSGSTETIEGAAVVEGDVQRITVDASTGSYNPNVIKLAANVPAEITFTQASGCLGQVQSADLDFYADLTGGAQTVRLEAAQLQPGTYAFSCGMQMVFGTIIVE